MLYLFIIRISSIYLSRNAVYEVGLGVVCDSREIEKPKVFGWSLKRRLRRVDLPAPEGPDMTTRGYFCAVLLYGKRFKWSLSEVGVGQAVRVGAIVL